MQSGRHAGLTAENIGDLIHKETPILFYDAHD